MGRIAQYIYQNYEFTTTNTITHFKEFANAVRTKVVDFINQEFSGKVYDMKISVDDTDGCYSVCIEAYNDCEIEAEYIDYNFCGQMGTHFNGYGVGDFIEPYAFDDIIYQVITETLSEMTNVTVVGDIECTVDGDEDIDDIVKRYENGY